LKWHKRFDKDYLLKRCKKYASLIRKGKCLSETYNNNSNSKMLWQCEFGHTWSSSPSSVLNHTTWCPECKGLQRKSIEDIRKIIYDKFNGKILDKIFINNKTKMWCECFFGHKFQIAFCQTLKGHWCYKCKSGISERICRSAFEEIFNCPFDKSRPIVLNNYVRLELDGYNDNVIHNDKKLKIAFEHQGEQHFIDNHLWIHEDFNKRVNYDEIKRNWCKENSIFLVEIPSLFNRLSLLKFKEFLQTEIKNKINIEIDFSLEKILRKAWLSPSNVKIFSEIQQVVEEKKGTLLNKFYFSSREKFDIICKRGHKLKRSSYELRSGKFWCKKCKIFEESKGFSFDKNKFASEIIVRANSVSFGRFSEWIYPFIVHKIACLMVWKTPNISIDKLKNDVKNHLDKKFSLWYKILLKDVDLKEKLEKLNKQYLTNY